MGPTFVKLGQFMTSRVDLLNPAYVEAEMSNRSRIALSLHRFTATSVAPAARPRAQSS
jgi:hypothetical protein